MTGWLDGAQVVMPPAAPATPPAATFGEAFDAARQNYDAFDLTTTNNLYAGRIGKDVVTALRAKGRKGFTGADGRQVTYGDDALRTDYILNPAVAPRIWQDVAAEQARDPAFLKGIGTPEEFRAAVLAARARDYQESAEVLGRAEGVSGLAAQLAGGLVGAAQDPLQIGIAIGTLPFGGPIVTALAGRLGVTAASHAAKRIGVEALAEAGLNVGATIPTLPIKAANAEEIGVEYGVGEAAMDLGVAGVFGAGVAGGLKLTGAAARGVASIPGRIADTPVTARLILKAFGEIKRPLTPDEVAARTVLEAEVATLDSSPFAPTQEGESAHIERLTEAVDALENDRPIDPTVFETPPPVAAMPLPRGADIVSFAPEDLQTDAARFQYKAGGDAAGVTDRLADVPEWSSLLSGKIVVWEDTAGNRFIADGHQRLGLARRAISAGQEGVRLDAVVLREADGVTAADARTWAALKNIAEGSGSAIDAAKVLRDSAEGTALPLPPRSALVRDARALAQLSDDAFVMVVNERVEPWQAVLVGQLAGDRQELHASLLQLLEQLQPPNRTQGESIVRQALALPTASETQLGLFGAETVTRQLFVERAKVIDAALRRMKSDKQLFGALVKDASTIEGAGNTLDTAANSTKADDNARAIQLLNALANRPGPVNDALARAAGAVGNGAGIWTAAKQFIDDLAGIDLTSAINDLGQVERGVEDGPMAGGTGRAGDDGQEAGSGGSDTGDAADDGPGLFDEADAAAGAEALKDFDEPGGAGATAQRESLEHDLRAEVEAVGPATGDILIANSDGEMTPEWEAHVLEREQQAQAMAATGAEPLFHGTSGPQSADNPTGLDLMFWATKWDAAARYAGAVGVNRNYAKAGSGRILLRAAPPPGKIIDVRTPEGMAVLSALPDQGFISGRIVRAARQDMSALQNLTSQDFNKGAISPVSRASEQIWSSTKTAGKEIAAEINANIVQPLRALGYEAIRFNDDQHETVGIFDQIQKVAPSAPPTIGDTATGSLGLDAVQAATERMTEAQRAEMAARLQQSQVRRGGQVAVDQMPGGLFDAQRDQMDIFALPDGRTASTADLIAEFDKDDAALKIIKDCL